MSDTHNEAAAPLEGDLSTIDAPLASLSVIREEPSLLESADFSSKNSGLREHFTGSDFYLPWLIWPASFLDAVNAGGRPSILAGLARAKALSKAAIEAQYVADDRNTKALNPSSKGKQHFFNHFEVLLIIFPVSADADAESQDSPGRWWLDADAATDTGDWDISPSPPEPCSTCNSVDHAPLSCLPDAWPASALVKEPFQSYWENTTKGKSYFISIYSNL